ncbi:MAG: YtxH domain-containing protein [Balneolaceae bacterium]|nr:YtxH domain-containing protein [Balneolaceae bacterium]
MAHRTKLEILLITTASFVCGVAAGLMLAPRSGRESREWMTDNATEIANWVDDKGRSVIDKGTTQVRRTQESIHKTVKNSLPDLYEATEQIELSNSSLTNG